MTFDKVAAILAEYKDIDASEVKMESAFSELELDSLDMAELVMNMEDEFGTSIEIDENVKTVAELVALIEAGKA